MASFLVLVGYDFKHLNESTQIDDSDNSSINHAFKFVALEISGLIQQSYPSQVKITNFTKTMVCDRSETVAIRAVEPEYRQIIKIEPPTERELEVLRLIVDGCSNSVIADKLYISTGTVKSHVRNILRKLCVSGRTQAAIRALRSGLIT